eukprot:scaffold66779_cov21-Tisochrysis_lutea.AAC.1
MYDANERSCAPSVRSWLAKTMHAQYWQLLGRCFDTHHSRRALVEQRTRVDLQKIGPSMEVTFLISIAIELSLKR